VSTAAQAKRDDGDRAYDGSEHGGQALRMDLAWLADIPLRISEEQSKQSLRGRHHEGTHRGRAGGDH
jgi:hypothetical protein